MPSGALTLELSGVRADTRICGQVGAEKPPQGPGPGADAARLRERQHVVRRRRAALHLDPRGSQQDRRHHTDMPRPTLLGPEHARPCALRERDCELCRGECNMLSHCPRKSIAFERLSFLWSVLCS